MMQGIGKQRNKPIATEDNGLRDQSSRGDKTAIELFITGIRAWEAGSTMLIGTHEIGYGYEG